MSSSRGSRASAATTSNRVPQHKPSIAQRFFRRGRARLELVGCRRQRFVAVRESEAHRWRGLWCRGPRHRGSAG
jgi:hypothetical protein